MPAFTAAAVAIVGWIGATGLAATILTTVIATGLAMVTSRLINGNPGGGSQDGGAASQGTRVQLQPSTENKIPVIYGEGYFTGIVTDAYLHDENKWMTYVMVIGETVNQNAHFSGTISAATSRLTATDVSDGDYGTIMTGMTITNAAGAVVGVVEEFISGVYGGAGVYRVSGAVETGTQMLDGKFVYTVGDVYWNDMRLEFENDKKGGKAIRGKKHVENTPYNPTTGAPNAEDHTDNNFKDHAEVYIYAGNSTGSKRIDGAGSQPAYELVGTQSTSAGTRKWLAPGLPGSERMEGLIFAVVKVKYDAEKGFTGIPGLTFKIRCSLDNPAVVLFDYMRSNRYGAGINPGSINAAALGDYANYCNELVSYQPYGSTAAPTTQKRYTINGVIDTNRNCKDNIDTILTNGGAWMAYDVHTGQWRVIPKRAVEANATYPNRVLPASLLTFNDNNILGGITISSTRLDDLYNIAEIEYFDRLNKDQKGFHSIEVNANERNYNEPDNAMRLTLDMCNSNVQAERVANLELKQSRDDVLVVFQTTHYGLQAQAGDVIQLEVDLYGWNTTGGFPGGKRFRVITTKEIEGNDGGMFVEITALEYNPDVYADEDISEFTTSANIGIIPRNSSVNIPAPIVQIEQDKVNASGGVPNFRLKILMPATGGPFDECQLWYSEGDDWAGIGGDTAFLADAAGDKIYVTTWQGPAVIRSLQDSGVATQVSGKGVPEGTYITAFGATNSPYLGNGLTGYYTLNQPVETRTGIVQMSGTIYDAEFTATCADTVLTVTNATAGSINPQSLIKGGVPSATITSATIVGTTLSVFTLTGTITPNSTNGTILRGQGLLQNTRVLTQVTSTEPGGALGGRGTYTISRGQSRSALTEITGLYPNIVNDTVIVAQLSGTTGGNGTYEINKSNTIGTAFTATSKYAYPLPATYQYLKSIKPDPQAALLFDQNSLRETFISSLPANGTNKKYFIKARLGIAGSYGAFSELGEVDLEPPVVYWEPDSQSALNIKTQLVKMDFGKFTIPRNGLWLMRTATQLDGGHLQTPTGDTFNMDLGNFEQESEIGANDLIEDFTYDPKDL